MTFGEDIDIASLRDRITSADGPAGYSYGRLDDMAEHMAMLQREFAGQPLLLFYHAWLVVRIRRGDAKAVPAFYELWKTERSILLQKLDSRWLVSACDTIVDTSADRSEAAFALAGSLLVATTKLYETEAIAIGATQRQTPHEYRQEGGRVALMDGLSAFHIGRGDLLFNLTERLERTAGTDSTAGSILRELFSRLHRHDTVFKRFLDVHTNEQTRWIP